MYGCFLHLSDAMAVFLYETENGCKSTTYFLFVQICLFLLSVLSNNKCNFSVRKNQSPCERYRNRGGGERASKEKCNTKNEGNANVPPLKVCEQKMEPIWWEYGCFKSAIKPL